MESEMSEQNKSTKTPQTVDTIDSFSNQIHKASYLMIFDAIVLQTKL